MREYIYEGGRDYLDTMTNIVADLSAAISKGDRDDALHHLRILLDPSPEAVHVMECEQWRVIR